MSTSQSAIAVPNDKSSEALIWLIKGVAVAGGLYHANVFTTMLAQINGGEISRYGSLGNVIYNLIATTVVLVAFWRLFKLKKWASILFCVGVWAAGTSLLVQGYEGVSDADPWIVLAFTLGTFIIVSGRKQLQSGF